MAILTCAECSAPFTVQQYRVGTARFCSRRCKGTHDRRVRDLHQARAAIGQRVVGTGGYVMVKVAHGHHQWKYEHVLVATRALGRSLPALAIIHHVDDDPAHNTNTNLVICEDQEYHLGLHRRRSVLRAGGDPFNDAWCSGCQAPRPLTAFSGWRRKSGRPQGLCRACASRWRRVARQRRVA